MTYWTWVIFTSVLQRHCHKTAKLCRPRNSNSTHTAHACSLYSVYHAFHHTCTIPCSAVLVVVAHELVVGRRGSTVGAAGPPPLYSPKKCLFLLYLLLLFSIIIILSSFFPLFSGGGGAVECLNDIYCPYIDGVQSNMSSYSPLLFMIGLSTPPPSFPPLPSPPK